MPTRTMTLSRPRTKTIPGYRIQAMLPITFYLDGTVEDANFTRYDGVDCVEASVQFGLVEGAYTFVFTIKQALEADIIERD